METGTIAVLAIVVSALALVFNIGLSIYSGGWNLSNKIADMEARLRNDIIEAKTELETRQDTSTRENGEGLAAIRQKVHEVEMWIRDTFVRRDSFLQVIAEVKTGFNDLGTRLEKRLDRMEEKIDGNGRH